jgi:predicted Rossmann fold flavoprotein
LLNETCDIAIVGAGAAGLATAIFAAQTNPVARVVCLDGAPQIGAKILVAGGGRCNVTHDVVAPADFNGPQPVVRNVLRAFDERRTVEWFASLGVELKREPTGKLFPVSDSAKTVLAALLDRCRALGVDVRTRHRVRAIERGFAVRHEQGELAARRVVLATGGRSLPRSGSDGFGYKLAKSLGHTVTDTWPALAPLKLESTMFHASLSGLAVDVEVSTFVAAKRVDRRRGSMLWTHFGVSGPIIMDASRHWTMAHGQGHDAAMRINFVPDSDFVEMDRRLLDRPKRNVVNALGDMLPSRLADALCRHVHIEPAAVVHQLPREQRRALARAVTELQLPIIADRGWNYAEVTAGGVPMSEVDYRTMQSRVCGGLYLVGELLDVDGRIGGFNFQWAWATGYLAGTAAGRACDL